MDTSDDRWCFRLPLGGASDVEFTGALSAWRGFNYQLAYTVQRLTDLLRDSTLHAIRIEGRQDLDIAQVPSEPGQPPPVIFVQLKDTTAKYTLASLARILKRFLSISRGISKSGGDLTGVRFHLVLAHRHFNDQVNNIYNYVQGLPENGVLPAAVTNNLAAKLAATTTETAALLDRLQIEVIEDRGQIRRAPLSSDAAIGENDADYLEYSTQFEHTALHNLQQAGLESLDDATHAFNTLRRIVAEAAGSRSLPRIFDRARVEELIRPALLRGTLSVAHGVLPVDEMFLDQERRDLLSELARPSAPDPDDPFASYPFLGEPAEWKHIAARLDFRRDILDAPEGLVDVLDRALAADRLSSIIVHGEPGSGKSTVVKRAAVDLLCSQRIDLIYEIRDPELLLLNTASLQRVLRRAVRPILFVAEDLFQNDPQGRVLRVLLDVARASGNRPCVVLATTTNDFRPSFKRPELKTATYFLPLASISEAELAAIRRHFPLSSSLGPALHDNSFLVAMMEATTGKKFADLLRRIKTRLESRDLIQVFEWLCAPGQFGVEIPESLLRRLLGTRARLLDGPEQYGFEDYARVVKRRGMSYWRSRHRKLAEEFLRLEATAPFLRGICTSLLECVNPANTYERRFLVHFLRRLAAYDGATTKAILDDIGEVARICQEVGSVFELSRYWPDIYRRLGESCRVPDLRARALQARPIESNEIDYLVAHYLRKGEWSPAADVCFRWLDSVESDPRVEAKLLDLHARRVVNAATYVKTRELATGSPSASHNKTRIREYIRKRWDNILKHPSTTPSLFGRFLSLVARAGTVQQRERSLNAAAAWLEARSVEVTRRDPAQSIAGSQSVSEVLIHYLRAVERWRITSFAAHLDSTIRSRLVTGATYDGIVADCMALLEGWKKEKETGRGIRLSRRCNLTFNLSPAARRRIIEFVTQFGRDTDVTGQIELELERFAMVDRHDARGDYCALWEALLWMAAVRGRPEDVRKAAKGAELWHLAEPAENPQWWRGFLAWAHLVALREPKARRELSKLATSLLVWCTSGRSDAEKTTECASVRVSFPHLPIDGGVADAIIRLLAGVESSDSWSLEQAVALWEMTEFRSCELGSICGMILKAGRFDLLPPWYLIPKEEEPAILVKALEAHYDGLLVRARWRAHSVLAHPPYSSRSLPHLYRLNAMILDRAGRTEEARFYHLRTELHLTFAVASPVQTEKGLSLDGELHAM